VANNIASHIPLTRRNYSGLAGVLSNPDTSDVSIRLQLAAQAERFLDRLDKNGFHEADPTPESGTLLRRTR
jgi:hypothetical protein